MSTDLKILEGEIRNIIAEIGEVDSDKIGINSKFVEDLGMDSMMALEVLAAIEKKFKLKIPENNLVKMTSIANLIEIIGKNN